MRPPLEETPAPAPAEAPRGNVSGVLHVSDSPYGPWHGVQPQGLPAIPDGMPHAHVFPNGSVYVIHQNSWRAFRAQHWSGPYTEVPFVFVDSRGKREGVKSPELRGAPQWE